MDNLLSIELQAHHTVRNHHRRYRVTVGKDLFQVWTVKVEYGRVGGGGQIRHYGGTAPAMRQVLREHLRRRLSAVRRIECAYMLTSLTVQSGTSVTDWLPPELLGSFVEARCAVAP